MREGIGVLNEEWKGDLGAERTDKIKEGRREVEMRQRGKGHRLLEQ